MGELLALLRDSGFLATTDDYVDLLKIIELYGHEGLDGLAARICPIIAMSPEEQERFYNVFEGYKKAHPTSEPPPPPPPGRHIWVTATAALLVLGLMLVVMLVLFKKEPIGLPAGRGDVTIAMSEPFESSLTGSGMFAERPLGDTAYVGGVWEHIGHGRIDSGRRIRHFFTEPGFHQIRRTIYSSRFPIINASDTTNVTVCGYLPRIRIYAPEHTQAAHAPLSFRAKVDTLSPLLKGYSWMVDELDTSFRTAGDAPFVYSFDTPGVHTIYCRADIPDNDYFCTRTTNVSIVVADTAQQYPLSFTGDGKPFILKKDLRSWPGLAALFISMAVAGWAIQSLRKRNPEKDDPPRPSEPAFDGRRGPPYEVPFAPVRPDEVIIDKPLRRFLQQLRLKAEEEVLEVDVRRSIRATIRNNGLAEAVLSPRRRIQDYLVFIDRRAPHGMLHALYAHLADVMESEGIPLTRFYYDADFKCYNVDYPLGCSLRNIADNFAGSVPVILGDGQALLHPVAPAIKPELLQELQRWERCLLITPTPFRLWQAGREGVLSRHLVLAAGDAASLEALGQQLRSGLSDRRKPVLPAVAARQQESAFSKLAFLKGYLDGDEAMFQWLCALCIYPKLRWELVVAIGKAVLARYGREGDLRYDVLLRMCRIPWMATGSFPQRLRGEMLKMLEVPNEVAARAALVSLLRSVDRRYPGDYVFTAEKKLQSLMSRFVLYASDNTRFAEHEHAVGEMALRIKAGTLTDVPARKYLESPADEGYKTPVQTEAGRSVGITEFVSIRDEQTKVAKNAAAKAARLKRATRIMTAAVAIVAVVSLWSALYLSKSLRQTPQMDLFYLTDSSQLIRLGYALEKDFTECGDSSAAFRVMPGTLYINDKPYGLSYDGQSKTLQASIPYTDLGKGGAQFRIMLGTNVARPSELQIDTLTASGKIVAHCSRYQSKSLLPENYNEIWRGPVNNRLVSINLRTGIIYYSTGSPKTYGTYRIDSVIALEDGYNTYQVITRFNDGFSAFFLRDATEGYLSIANCPYRYADKTSAIAAKPSCASFFDIAPFYEDIPNKIFLPVAPLDGSSPSLEQAQVRKILNFIYKTPDAAAYTLGYELFKNPSFINSYSDYNLKADLKDNYPNINTKLTGLRYMEVPNPFQRENLELADLSDRKRSASVKTPVGTDVPLRPMDTLIAQSDAKRMTNLRAAITGGSDRVKVRVEYDEAVKTDKEGTRIEAAYEYAKYLVDMGQGKEAEGIIADAGKPKAPNRYYYRLQLVRVDALEQRNNMGGLAILQQIAKECPYQDIRAEANKRMGEYNQSNRKSAN